MKRSDESPNKIPEREKKLKAEKVLIRNLIKTLHPDRDAGIKIPEEVQKSKSDLIIYTNALLDMNAEGRLIEEDSWPKGTNPPEKLTFSAPSRDNTFKSVTVGLDGTPKQVFRTLSTFADEPSTFIAQVLEQQEKRRFTQAEQKRHAQADLERREIERQVRDAKQRKLEEQAQA